MNILNKLESMVGTGWDVSIGRLGMLGMILKGKGADSPEQFTYNLTYRVNTPSYAEYTVSKQLQDISYGIKR